MDSWTLQGDSYSFLRSAPRNFSLCHRDGTPNHVEIFDIINTPIQRSAISETTCLCDIFGDDKESHLSSSPAAGTFAPSLRELEVTAAASPLVDDLNESSSSYHTAPGSSEGEEGFEDSREKLYSPSLQSEHAERKLLEKTVLDSKHSEVCEDRSPDLDRISKSPTLQQTSISPSSQFIKSGERTPSSGHNSPHTQGRLSSVSSLSVEKGLSPPIFESKVTELKTEPRVISPSFKDRQSSLSHNSLIASPSFELTGVGSSLSESGNRELQNSPETRNLSLSQKSTPSPEVTPEVLDQDITDSNVEVQSIHSSHLPSPYGSQSLSQSRESLVCPEFISGSLSDVEPSSPLSELRGRISLPDLFSRGSTPDKEEYPQSPQFTFNSFSPKSHSTFFSESAEPNCAVLPLILTVSPSNQINIALSPEFEHTVSAGFSSPTPCSVASSTKSGTWTSSPYPLPNPVSPGVKIQELSPVINSLSPSPAKSETFSSKEYRYNSPSPETRILTSSPEVNREEASSEIGTTPSSLFLDPDTYSIASISPTFCPHITGISYSVVQPEDRDSPPFPELSHFSTEELESTLESLGERSLSGSRNSSPKSIAKSTGTPRGSPHTVDLTNSVTDSRNTPFGYQIDSPLLNYFTPSPDVRHPNPSPHHQIFTPEQRDTDLSATVLFSDKHSSLACTTNYNPHSTSSAISTPDVEREFPSVAVTEQSPKPLAQNSESLRVIHCNSENPQTTDSQSHSHMIVNTPGSNSLAFKEDKLNSAPEQQETENKDYSKENRVQDKSRSAYFPEENKTFSGHTFQTEDTYSNSLPTIKSASSNTAKSISPYHSLEDLQSHFTPYPVLSESRGLLKPYYTPQISRRQLLTNYSQENKTRNTEDMSHRVEKRRTPSPPLTRFTPIHIIAPEKPYRHWQDRSHSPSQIVAPSQRRNSNKAVTDRECPNVAPVEIFRQSHWVGPERQLEREQEFVEQRDVSKERQRERGVKKERKREERVTEKGEGWQSDASYRGEQVELSFSARNRKGPASCSAGPTSRESRQGLPTVHSYSESFLATRQLQQQQNLLRLASQQDSKGVGASRQHQPHKKSSAPVHLATKRPCRSSSSSMGSELDEADNEVKWFSDLAFRSLSSPEVDYLDMYNSSHRSSTNISQPSTQESPAGVKSPWLSYADFKGSTAKLDQEELSFQHTPAYNTDSLDPSRRYELGSFECVDVAVEREDMRKVRRGVPKRQIQLKRRNDAEGIPDESSDNSSPGIPVFAENPSQGSISRGTFVRQHSTPAVMQECYPTEHNPEHCQDIDFKSKLQKSASVDETGNKTKIASHLIKNVLSKKMQSFDKQSDEQGEEELCPNSEDDILPTVGGVPQNQESNKNSEQNLSSSFQSDYSLSSEGLPVKAELTAKDDAKPPKGFLLRPSNRSSSSSSSRSVNFSMTSKEEVESQNRYDNLLRPEMRSELKVPFDRDPSEPALRQADDSKTYERELGGTAVAPVMNTETSSTTGASSTQARVCSKSAERENTEDHNQLQHIDKYIIPKTMENKKASLDFCLASETENQPETLSLPNVENTNSCKYERAEDSDDSNAVKAPLHKVRDVRRLVKNTYNLSFKATTIPSNVSEEKTNIFKEERKGEIKICDEKGARQEIVHKEKENELWKKRKNQQNAKSPQTITLPLQKERQSPFNPHPMQIQCKAVCWKEEKDKTPSFNKDLEYGGDQPPASPNPVNEVSKESLNVPNCPTGETSSFNKQNEVNIAVETESTAKIHEVAENKDNLQMVKTERKPTMLESLPKIPSKEREVSTAVVLIREGPSQTKCSTSQVQEEISKSVDNPSLLPDLSSAGAGGHSVSMLLKEKGYQADIGAVVGENQNTLGIKEVPHKHVNRLEIPLQTNKSSCGILIESYRENKNVSSSSVQSGKTETVTKTTNGERSCVSKPMEIELLKEKIVSPIRNLQKDTGDFEAVKRLDPTIPPRSPIIRRFKPQLIQAMSLSKEPEKKRTPSNPTGSNRPQSIEVKSIAKNSQKPVVPPKPSCKFKPTDFASAQNDAQRHQVVAQAQTIVVSSPTIYRKISNEAPATSNYSRKLAVSAVSSLKPPPHKTASTTVFSLSNLQSTTKSDTEVSNDGGKESPQSSRNAQKSVTLATASTSGTCSGGISVPGTITDPKPYPTSDPALAEDNQQSQTAVIDSDNQLQHPREAYLHEQGLPVTPNRAKQPATVSTMQVPRYLQQPFHRPLSSERSQRADDLRFMASDDPPSYDERESFSPLTLPDLTPLRSTHYQLPTSHRPQCSCTAGCHAYPSLSAPPHHCSPHNLTPPMPSQSPGQALPYPVVQPPLRPQQGRLEPQQITYQPGSPKASPIGPSQPPNMFQPLHQCAPCPPHLMQNCPAERSLQPLPQQIDPRRPPVHRSPHQQVPILAVPSYSEPGQNHSPALPSIDHQYVCGPQNIGPSYGSEYGGDSSSLYSESSYAQTPRRVLLDPETGKYFYIDVPVQPLRKMLFDPETGQYVEVLIPQQAMSHSGLYPPSAAPYPPLHNPNMYATAPQYMPYTAAPASAHPQTPIQPPRYPDTSVTTTMHPPGLGYRNPPGQGSKPETQNHPPMDHSYLESMYYVPTGMNASPNPTPPDYYYKHPPNLPPTVGKRS